MFGWFRVTCPIDEAAKAWIEERLQWLFEEFDAGPFRGDPVILPTHEFFPDPYDGSEESVRTMLDRVCGYMGVAPDRTILKLFNGPRSVGLVNEQGRSLPGAAAGTYKEIEDGFIIRINRLDLDNPMNLVGTLAHELAHARLLGENRVARTVYDNELLTDLTAVYHGFGIFLANSPRHWDSKYTVWPGSKLKKPEYMTGPMFGYTLAHLAWFGEESKPAWARHLHSDARANFKQSLRYLEQTDDSEFRPPWRRRGTNK